MAGHYAYESSETGYASKKGKGESKSKKSGSKKDKSSKKSSKKSKSKSKEHLMPPPPVDPPSHSRPSDSGDTPYGKNEKSFENTLALLSHLFPSNFNLFLIWLFSLSLSLSLSVGGQPRPPVPIVPEPTRARKFVPECIDMNLKKVCAI